VVALRGWGRHRLSADTSVERVYTLGSPQCHGIAFWWKHRSPLRYSYTAMHSLQSDRRESKFDGTGIAFWSNASGIGVAPSDRGVPSGMGVRLPAVPPLRDVLR